MDEQQKPPPADDGAQRWREDGARRDPGPDYWQTHEIVQRSENEIRRGEASAYVRPRK